MVDHIDLGSCPADEDCAQVGQDGYEERARHECNVYIAQLKRAFAESHDGETPLCRLRVKRNLHDFGSYYEVVASFNDNVTSEIKSALWFESNAPMHWDEQSKRDLKA